MTVMPGDYTTTDFGDGYDVVLQSGMMHRETPEVRRRVECRRGDEGGTRCLSAWVFRSSRRSCSVRPVSAPRSGEANRALASIWARTKIADLMDELAWSGDASITTAVRTLALDYSLMSRFTAFLAVDSLTITEGSYGVTVAQPVPVPEGVRYDTTVQTR